MAISLVKNKAYLIIKGLIKNFFFLLKYNFPPPPLYSDMSGYERLLDMVIKKNICNLEGDIVEIGVFLGGGTYKM